MEKTSIKKTTKLIFVLIGLFLIIPAAAFAYETKTGNVIYVPKDETVTGNLYAGGTNITVDGTVDGDVICAGQSVTVNGEVKGDVICAGQSVTVNGAVDGSVRVAGNSVTITGPVARNVQAFGNSVILADTASVGWEMFMAADTGEVRGKIAGDLSGAAANAVISGNIGRDVRLRLGNKADADGGQSPLTVTKDAVINGSLTYTSASAANIEQGATIKGGAYQNQPSANAEKTASIFSAWAGLFSLFAALVVGMVLVSIMRERVRAVTDRMLEKISHSIGWGVAVLFLTPIIGIILLITVIGIPLSLMLLALWLIAIYISKILVGILIGRSVVEKLWRKKKESLIWSMIIGIVIVWIITGLPYVGWILTLIAIWWGMGGIWLMLKKEKA